MPRAVASQRWLTIGAARDRLFIETMNASVTEKVAALKKLEKDLLKDARTSSEKVEIKRRIAEDLLGVMTTSPWARFVPYLRRLERLGYSNLDRRLHVCFLVAEASKGSAAGKKKAASMIADVERRTRSARMHPAFREEVTQTLARAKELAGLSSN